MSRKLLSPFEIAQTRNHVVLHMCEPIQKTVNKARLKDIAESFGKDAAYIEHYLTVQYQLDGYHVI